jgi:Secretion system C-terminal sorting domain
LTKANINLLEKHLYVQVKENTVLAAEPLMQTFITEKDAGTFGSLLKIEEGIVQIFKNNPDEKAKIVDKEAQMKVLRKKLFELDSLRSLGLVYDATQYASKYQELSALTEDLRQIVNTRKENERSMAKQLILQNAAITVSEVWEKYDAQVNELTLFLLQNDSLDATQKAQVLSIASLCPAQNGEAVLRARALYNLFAPTDFRDEASCIGGRSEDNETSKEFSTLSVFPNPTTGICYISGLQSGKYKATIQNVAGMQVSLPILDGNRVDLQDYPSGVYFLHLNDKESKRIEVMKILLIKD